MDKQILPVGNILVGKEITEISFKCDLLKCRGACCTFESRYGAPLRWEEVNIINELLTEVLRNLPQAHKEEIEERGFYEVKKDEPMISSIDNRACVFVYYENDIAKCAMEKAYIDGKTDFRKPISCHLFPIRISDFGGDVLRFEQLDVCQPAIQSGKKENTTVAEFCEDSLSRLYGKEWYSQFMELIGR